MSTRVMRSFAMLGLAAVLPLLGGCDSSGSTTYRVSTGYYSGPGWYDPYYYRPCCYGNVIVRPPPGYRPPGHRPPGYRPPGNRPPPGYRPPGGRPPPAQLPSRPRPMPRPAMRR